MTIEDYRKAIADAEQTILECVRSISVESSPVVLLHALARLTGYILNHAYARRDLARLEEREALAHRPDATA